MNKLLRTSRGKFFLEPEAGWHPSNPVVERSWDAVFYCHEKIVALIFEFFRECVYIMNITI